MIVIVTQCAFACVDRGRGLDGEEGLEVSVSVLGTCILLSICLTSLLSSSKD